jgi:hypothetical protein
VADCDVLPHNDSRCKKTLSGLKIWVIEQPQEVSLPRSIFRFGIAITMPRWEYNITHGVNAN